jgi:glucose/arabinose dehydrogenase
MNGTRWFIAFTTMTLAACGQTESTPAASVAASGADNSRVQVADISLPAGFNATVFADELGTVRHLAVRSNGDLYGTIRQRGEKDGGLVVMRDKDGDGINDGVRSFGPKDVTTGLTIHKDVLYFSSNVTVYKMPLEKGRMVPTGKPEVVVDGFPEQRGHADKPITFDREDHIYVGSGVPSNACQEEPRNPGSMGLDPCPQLERAGIWRYPSGHLGQVQEDGTQYTRGSRQIVAMEWHPVANALYFVMHGRDSLDTLFPEYFSEDQRVELPAEEFHRAEQGDNFGWPYTYFDPQRGERMVGPEYGGDGKTAAEAGKYKDPLIGFPAHWAPNDLVFYTGRMFPERYRGGAFIAFHGSWNRGPQAQGGFCVVFVPMKDGVPSGDWEIFADDFEGPDPVISPRDARFRPAGLAVAPDGALYIGEDATGRIWRVTHTGG